MKNTIFIIFSSVQIRISSHIASGKLLACYRLFQTRILVKKNFDFTTVVFWREFFPPKCRACYRFSLCVAFMKYFYKYGSQTYRKQLSFSDWRNIVSTSNARELESSMCRSRWGGNKAAKTNGSQKWGR